MDGYANAAFKDIAIEDVPVKMGAFTKTLQHVTEPFLVQGFNSVAALNRGTAAFYTHLDSIADYIELSTGVKSEGLFEKLAEMAEKDSERWAKAADELAWVLSTRWSQKPWADLSQEWLSLPSMSDLGLRFHTWPAPRMRIMRVKALLSVG